ncbi:MAG: hypothetical protein HXY40_17505 [Chloroflexi bacterium]|nr:hypothetical protein [Chloroflexota bacterium]
MAWQKLGRIFDPADYTLPWLRSHAALPVVMPLAEDSVRIYFSGRDSQNRAHIGCFHFDLRTHTVQYLAPEPLVRPGEIGMFDDSGVTTSCIVQYGGRHYLYYSGWALGVTVPFYFFIGAAHSSDGGATFEKVSPAPIMGWHTLDPYLLGSPFILVEDTRWRMWYVSGVKWEQTDTELRHYYLIKYAESRDGLQWERNGHICIPFASADEYAIARPFVLKEHGLYKMWYAYRGAAYRIGYAESPDGLHWTRKDGEVGIDVSPQGWDAEMVEYPYIYDHDKRRYMFYNGNGYGKSGIGLAVWHE